MASQSDGFDGFARNVHFFTLGIPIAMTKAVTEGAQTVKTAVTATEAEATGGDFTLSGLRKRAPLFKPRFKVVPNNNDPVAIVSIRGAAHLIEWDTAPHSTRKRSRAQAKAGKLRKRLPAGASGPVLSGPAAGRGALERTHPGTKGKHPFERGVNIAAPSVVANMTLAFQRHMLRSWR